MWIARESVQNATIFFGASVLVFGALWVMAGKYASEIKISNGNIEATFENGKKTKYLMVDLISTKTIKRITFEEFHVKFTGNHVLKFTSYFYDYEEIKSLFTKKTTS